MLCSRLFRAAASVFALVAAAGFLTLCGRAAIARVETVDAASLAPRAGARFVQTRSGRVHVLDIGEGPPVLLLHGSGGEIVDWRQGLAQRLARTHRVIAFDYYGSGYSDRPASVTYGYDLWVQQAIDVLDALGVEHATVVGHSVGGVVACMLAAEHARRVDHVVTIGTGMEIEPAQFLLVAPGVGEIALARMQFYGIAHSPAHRAARAQAFRVKGTRAALLQYARRQMTVDGLRLLTGVFEQVKAPVLHLSGSGDTDISPDAARALADRSGGRFEAIEGVGHDAHILAPDRVAEHIERFVRSPPRRAATAHARPTVPTWPAEHR